MNAVNKPTKFYDREVEDRGRVPDISKQGYFLIKRFHMFGWAPTYRHQESGHVLMYYCNQFIGLQALYEHLKSHWRPVKQAERLWCLREMKKYFQPTQWSGK